MIDKLKIRVSDGKVTFITAPIHASHKLSGGRGLVWCWKCGKYAVERALGLTKVCPGVPSSYGALNLKRLGEGKPPYSLGQWPQGDVTIFRQLVISR